MTKWFSCAALAALLVTPTPATAGDLRLSIANGRVTIVAQDVSIKQILDEWGRIGQTTVVGAERLVGPTVTLELHDVPEARALETLLRSASGYIAKPRAATLGASAFDRILIMPPSRAPAVSAPPPTFAQRPQPQVVMPNVVVDDDEPSPIVPPGMTPPGTQQFPGPAMQPGMQVPPTLSRPGMLPAPAPGFPGNPYQTNPAQPGVRPPGVPGGGPGGPGGAQPGTGPGGGPGGGA
jgi:hypothetical protein